MAKRVHTSFDGRALVQTRVQRVITLAFFLGLAPSAFSQVGQEKAATKGTEISDKGADRTLATSINFAKDLGLHFDSLLSFGARTELALRIADPVCLASLAKELSVYEQVSGKTSKLTSATLFKEAVAMAEARNDSAELKAVAQFVRDEATVNKLGRLAEVAEASEETNRQASKSGERTRGINRNLIVHNNTGWQVQVFEDGRHLGWVNPYGNYMFYIGHGPSQNSVLQARSSDGSRTWPGNGPRIIDNNILDYNWYLD
jgi:hypothetical protein